jgi:hypothetical protein
MRLIIRFASTVRQWDLRLADNYGPLRTVWGD